MPHFSRLKRKQTPLIFTCEHASALIPAPYKNLGLTTKQRRTAKDLNDPGALDLASCLANDLKTSLISARFSRLVIDANRLLGSKSNKTNTYHTAALKSELMVEDEKGERLIPIPGNQVKNPEQEEKRRWNRYVRPYYHAIESLSRELLGDFDRIYIFQIHSFYPKYNGDVRKVDIGVIHDKTSEAIKLVGALRQATDLNIGDNQPWGMQAVGGGVLAPLKKPNKIIVIGLDINNKHLRQRSSARKIQKLLGRAIQSVIEPAI